MSYLSTFTSYIEEFIEKLCNHYPEDKDFLSFKTYIFLLKKTNPRKIFEIFKKHCIQYKEQIKNKDEEFLLKTDFTKEKNNDLVNDITDKNPLDIMKKLKKYWNEMDKETKESVWQYLNLFVMLSSKINES